MYILLHWFSLLLLATSAITLIALQMKLVGWLIFSLGILTLIFCNNKWRREISLVYLSLGILSITPISTDIRIVHFTQMAIGMFFAIALPYSIARFVYKEPFIQFRFHHGRNWYMKELGYILGMALVVYLLFPFMLRETGSYANWTVEPNARYLLQFFIGINLVGIWDEVFFMSTALAILRRNIPFLVANLIQSVIFTSFLYELGFRGWAFLAIFLFAFLQGKVFQKTDSLFYLITIHLTADFILYLALIHAYYPNLMPIFLIK